ncbi:hypothetical protein QW131_06540 [Roseibium salinum]|nr:hypothetical protein [Roseibium salinum]
MSSELISNALKLGPLRSEPEDTVLSDRANASGLGGHRPDIFLRTPQNTGHVQCRLVVIVDQPWSFGLRNFGGGVQVKDPCRKYLGVFFDCSCGASASGKGSEGLTSFSSWFAVTEGLLSGETSDWGSNSRGGKDMEYIRHSWIPGSDRRWGGYRIEDRHLSLSMRRDTGRIAAALRNLTAIVAGL